MFFTIQIRTDDGTVETVPGPLTSSWAENVKRVQDVTDIYCCWTVRDIAVATNVPFGSCWSILRSKSWKLFKASSSRNGFDPICSTQHDTRHPCSFTKFEVKIWCKLFVFSSHPYSACLNKNWRISTGCFGSQIRTNTGISLHRRWPLQWPYLIVDRKITDGRNLLKLAHMVRKRNMMTSTVRLKQVNREFPQNRYSPVTFWSHLVLWLSIGRWQIAVGL